MRALLACGLGLLGLLGLSGCDGGSGYKQRGGQWLYDDHPFEPVAPRSLRPIDRLFARDDQRAYYRGQLIEGSDGASFEVLSEHEARDRTAVYYADTFRRAQEYWSISHVRVTPVQDAVAATYRVLGHGYASDGRRAYFEGRALRVRDAASFQPIDRRFARDAQRGYFEGIEIPDSDGPSFELIDAGDVAHVRDHARVWHAHIEINDPNQPPHPAVTLLLGARPASVRVLGQGYAVDGAAVWCRGRRVPQADAASFTLVEPSTDEADARDAHRSYRSGQPSGAASAPQRSR
jgi:hypothetical protein